MQIAKCKMENAKWKTRTQGKKERTDREMGRSGDGEMGR